MAMALSNLELSIQYQWYIDKIGQWSITGLVAKAVQESEGKLFTLNIMVMKMPEYFELEYEIRTARETFPNVHFNVFTRFDA